MCGEQLLRGEAAGNRWGSPPRVRGTGYAADPITRDERITPACAGNRLKKARHFYILFCQIKRIHLV